MREGAAPPDWRRVRWWKRTRLGLLLFGMGLLLAWIPFVAAIAALFLALGSTFLFLGMRAAGRKHEVAVVLAYLALTVGGVIIGVLVAAFLLQALDAARAGLPLSALREPAGLMMWGTLPATLAVSAGFTLQLVYLIPRRQRWALGGAAVVLAGTAALATVLSTPEVSGLSSGSVTTASVLDLLTRLSLYRMLEAPAYLVLAILYILTYWDAGLEAPSTARGGAAGARV